MGPGMLLAYDAAGDVIATLDYLTARGDDGQVIGLVDFAAHEAAGGKLRDCWDVAGAAGSATWPEWLSGRAHEFRVELDGDRRIQALVHRASGHRREREVVESAIRQARTPDLRGDIRPIVGGPDRPLRLDGDGRTEGKGRVPARRTLLPLVGQQRR